MNFHHGRIQSNRISRTIRNGLTVIAVLFLANQFAVSALADIALDVESEISQGSNAAITLTATGADLITELDLVLIVEDGGEAQGGVATDPPIVDVIPQGFLAGGDFGFSPAANPTNSPLAVIGTISVGTAVAPGVDGSAAASIFFDTSQLQVGDTFDLALAGFGVETLFSNNGVPVDTTFPLSFQITVVPEPSSLFVFGGLGALLIGRRRRV